MESIAKRIKQGIKSVVRLDKNFHIYIHGSSDKIEFGESKTKGKWIKLYYKEIIE